MSTEVRHIRFRVRGRTAAAWTSLNEILLEREIGLETNTRKFKFGDGTTPWNSLLYAGGTGGTGVEGVTGINGIEVDNTDPLNPVVTLSEDVIDALLLAVNAVREVQAGTNVTVDDTDPLRPIVNASASLIYIPLQDQDGNTITDQDGNPVFSNTPATGTDFVLRTEPTPLLTFALSGLPAPSPAARMIYVTGLDGGDEPCFSDATNWRRCSDRSIAD